MRFSPLYWRLLLTTLAGTAAACNQAPPLVGQVAAQADSASDVLGMLPASLPAADADRTLVPVAAEAIATSFRPDKFTGEPGSYRGFAPGFTAEIIARSRFLRFADFLFPYGASEGRFVPVVFRTQDLYIYPALRVEGAAIVPVFIVRRVLVAPDAVVLPVTVPEVYVSPVTVVLVPPPVVVLPPLPPPPHPTEPPPPPPPGSPPPTEPPPPGPPTPPPSAPASPRPPRPPIFPSVPVPLPPFPTAPPVSPRPPLPPIFPTIPPPLPPFPSVPPEPPRPPKPPLPPPGGISPIGPGRPIFPPITRPGLPPSFPRGPVMPPGRLPGR